MTRVKKRQGKRKIPQSILDSHYQTWLESVERDYKLANKIYRAQDSLTQEAVDRIADRLLVGAQSVIKIGPTTRDVDKKITEKNAFRAAIAIIQDLAVFDIRIANYKPIREVCGECGKRLAKRKSVRKSKRKSVKK